MQVNYGIIVLSQIDDTVFLYCNCIKYGYAKIEYFNDADPEEITEIPITDPEVTISGLLPGSYTFYAVDTENDISSPVFITISEISQKKFLSNILTAAGLNNRDILSAVDQINDRDYVFQMYQLLSADEKDSTLKQYGEEMLTAFSSAYNLEQETLNKNEYLSFQITDKEISNVSGISYQFVPYFFDPVKKQWVLEKNNIVNDVRFIINNNKTSVLRQILVLSDFHVVRKYFIYQPSESVSETILERQITKIKNINEELRNLLTDVDLTELADDEIGQKTVLSISHMMPERPLFKKPEISFDEEIGLTVTIPDYQAFTLTEKNIYLAALELDEVFNEKPAPHKILITDKTMTIRPSSFLINSDLHYVFYLIDDKDIMLSEIVLFSFDNTFPVQEYMRSYMRIAYDKYVRRLHAVFRKYRKQDWDKINTLLSRFLLIDVSDTTIQDFLIQQVLRQHEMGDRPDLWLQLILLCQLLYYSNVDQDFIHEQVYSKEFFSHILPEKPSPYLIRITKINEDEAVEDYCIGGSESTSIRIDKNDYILIQCIDPDTWKISPIAFYNNRIKDGARYFYFPNLKVEVI